MSDSVKGQAGVLYPLPNMASHVRRLDRGVHVPDGMSRDEIMLLSAIIEDEFELQNSDGDRIAVKILDALRQVRA